MRLSELASVSGRPVAAGSPDPDILGLSADSRSVGPGFLFAALPGQHADGWNFVPEALRRGARAVLSRPGEPLSSLRQRGIGTVPDRSPRRRLARMAACFHAPQPPVAVAVTGTNGKTSIAHFLARLWDRSGEPVAEVGTLGIRHGGRDGDGSQLTTPDPVALHATLARLSRSGVRRVVLEASSHGLDQRRLDGVRLEAGVLASMGRDHLDYHVTLGHYRAAKRRLFRHLVRVGGSAILNADANGVAAFERAAERRGLRIVRYGRRPDADWRLLDITPLADGQRITVASPAGPSSVVLPVEGAFQAGNAVAAAAAASVTGLTVDDALAGLSSLEAPPGRLERVASYRGASVYVDYAHTPDALDAALAALRPHVTGRLHLVFGCGGDRDQGKRPLMGSVANRSADRVVVTDDNPRSEDPARIRDAIVEACPDATVIGDREEAIHHAMEELRPGDALVVAGKGHESVQMVGELIRPFDDRAVVRQLARGAA